jgi:hypothetical protein
MKKTLRIVSLVLPLLLVASNSYAAVKAGSACSKAGSKSVSGGKSYTCVKSGKKLVWDKGVLVAVAKPSVAKPSSTTSAQPTPTPSQSPASEVQLLQISDSPEPLQTCRIPDQSPLGNRKAGPSIAYPLPTGSKYAPIPNKGEIRGAIIPIDFSDAPGTESPEVIYKDELKVIAEWMKWYSNGQSYFTWQTSNKWLRAPRPSYDYVAMDTPQSDRANPFAGSKIGREINSVQIASEFYDLAAKDFDVSNFHTVLFLYPRDILNIYDLIVRNAADQGLGDSRKSGFQPKVIDQRLLKTWVMSTGSFLYRNGYPLWSWMVHEVLHNLGLQGHAPNQGSPLGIMTNQWGASLALNAWDTTVLDWQRDKDVYCVKKEDIKQQTQIMLSPLEREEVGNKSIMIKLSASEILVVESHRRDRWSSGHLNFAGLPSNFKGIVVYKVDTTKTPLYGIEEPDGASWKDSSDAFAYYIRNNDVSHGYLNTSYGRLDLNFVIYEGESLITNGIKISLDKSSSHDTVSIMRAG